MKTIIPETVILAMQKIAWEYRTKYADRISEREMAEDRISGSASAEMELKEAEDREELAKRQIWEIAWFLQENNSDAMREGETWFDELLIDPNECTLDDILPYASVDGE